MSADGESFKGTGWSGRLPYMGSEDSFVPCPKHPRVGEKKTAIFVQKFHNSLLLTLQPSECIKNVRQKKKKKSISGACFGRKGALYCLCAALTVVIIISIIISSIIVMFGWKHVLFMSGGYSF